MLLFNYSPILHVTLQLFTHPSCYSSTFHSSFMLLFNYSSFFFIKELRFLNFLVFRYTGGTQCLSEIHGLNLGTNSSFFFIYLCLISSIFISEFIFFCIFLSIYLLRLWTRFLCMLPLLVKSFL